MNITIARSTCEVSDGLRREGGWVGRDRTFLELRLWVGPRFTPRLTISGMGTGFRREIVGWRAVRVFESLSGRMVERKAVAA